MNNDARVDSTTEASNAAENADVTALGDDQLNGEGSEEKQWREDLDNCRLSMGEAEETCVFLVEDLLAAIFQEMQVRSENASLFSLSARQMCNQAYEGVDMSAFQASDSLDRIPGPTQYELSRRQQVLKPQSKWVQSPQFRTRTSVASTSASSLVHQTPPQLLFLRRLLNFLEARAVRADLELLRFPTSEAISSLSGKRKLIGGTSGSNEDSHGEWCISVDHIPAFLQGLVSKGLVSAVPSTIAFVMAANHDSLERKMHTPMHVALPHLQHLVQKALLAAEEEGEQNGAQNTLSQRTVIKEAQAKTETESTPRSRIFQTEVPLNKVSCHGVLKVVTESADQPKAGPREELLSSYQEEVPPRAIEMDRRAPGQVGKKAALSAANVSKRAISRKIMLLLAPAPRQGSKWMTVRHKVIVPSAKSDGATTITAEADMEVCAAGDRHPPSALAERSATRLSIQTAGAGAITDYEDAPDAAALSNIFSLGTPRQLSAQELARRNDLLAQLQRDAVRAQRRATTTGTASMSLSGRLESDDAGCSSQEQFQAYVAANSIVTTGVQSDGHSVALSPTRPQQSDEGGAPRSRGRANFQRSKFELERDTLPFAVSDGNAHVREEQDRFSMAMCSPIRRPRVSSIAPSPSPEIPGRPIQTASMAPLPQLDSSRLAVGVSAVVRGVEKRGPRRNPSRKSRLQLHNYSAAFDLDEHPKAEVKQGQMPFSPVRTSAPPSFAAPASRGAPPTNGAQESYRLPMIPAVSPIKASPHRKHVAFKVQDDTENERAPASVSPKSHVRQRPSAKMKQPVWDAKTLSPPRARNRHFASGKNFRKIHRYEDDDEESSSARRQMQEEQAATIFHQPMAAPRRNVLSPASEYDED